MADNYYDNIVSLFSIKIYHDISIGTVKLSALCGMVAV